MKLALPFVALGLLVSPTFMGTSALGETPSVRAEEMGVGIRVEDRDRDWYRDRHTDLRPNLGRVRYRHR